MFTLAHLSDPHIGPLPRAGLHHLASKRLIGYVNWHRNRKAGFRPDILRDLVAAIRAAKPDHIAVTGDLVNIALPAEMSIARAWLDALGDPAGVTVIPGNHDAYVPGSVARAGRQWQPFMTGDEGERKPPFPFVRRRGGVALIGTSTARASAPMMATGHMSDRQIEAMRLALIELGQEGLFRVVLIHHPPIPRSTPWPKRLVRAERFRDALRDAGAELVLHGHNHVGMVNEIAGRHGPIPVVGVPAASNAPGGRHHPGAAFNLYRIERKSGRFACHMTEYGFTEPDKPVRLIGERQLLG